MRAWLLDQPTGLSALRLAHDVAEPELGPHDVLLKVQLAALNPADRYLAERQYPAQPSYPHILGRDGVGTVVRVGSSVQMWNPGDSALIIRCEIGVGQPGTFAECVRVPAESIAPVPAGWSAEQAAGAALVYLTAWQALHQWGPLPSGVVLVTGASGGVGVACVQLGKAAGHTIIGLSRSERKSQILRSLGADFMFDPQSPRWRKDVKDALDGRHVDLAIDNIGGDAFNQVLDTLGMNGRVSCVGRLAGPVPQFNTASLFFRRLRIGGVAASTYTPAEAQDVWRQIVSTLQRAGARPVVDEVFAFDQLPAAFDRLAAGPMGKVLLRVGAVPQETPVQ